MLVVGRSFVLWDMVGSREQWRPVVGVTKRKETAGRRGTAYGCSTTSN